MPEAPKSFISCYPGNKHPPQLPSKTLALHPRWDNLWSMWNKDSRDLSCFCDHPLGHIKGLPTGRRLQLSTCMLPAFYLCGYECTSCPVSPGPIRFCILAWNLSEGLPRGKSSDWPRDWDILSVPDCSPPRLRVNEPSGQETVTVGTPVLWAPPWLTSDGICLSSHQYLGFAGEAEPALRRVGMEGV